MRTFASVHCLVVTCWERADLLALVGNVYCIFVTFPCYILGQVWYMIVSFPGVCRLFLLCAFAICTNVVLRFSWRDFVHFPLKEK